MDRGQRQEEAEETAAVQIKMLASRGLIKDVAQARAKEKVQARDVEGDSCLKTIL